MCEVRRELINIDIPAALFVCLCASLTCCNVSLRVAKWCFGLSHHVQLSKQLIALAGVVTAAMCVIGSCRKAFCD